MSVKSEILDGVRGARVEIGTVTSANPASVAADSAGTVVLTITGVDTSDLVFVNARGLADGLVVQGATATDTDEVTVQLQNTTESAVDDAASDYDYVLVKRAD